MVITAVQCMTAVGLDAMSTATAVRAGISALRVSEQYDDSLGEPIIEACMPLQPADVADEVAAQDIEAADDDPSPYDEADEDETASGDADAEAAEDEEDEEDIYGLARQADDVERVRDAARRCLAQLLDERFGDARASNRTVRLFLGAAPPDRPGPRFEGDEDELARELTAILRTRWQRAESEVIRTGHAAAIHALQLAAAGLNRDPASLYIVGAVDSLVAQETLNWYEDAQRLKSGSFGRHQGIAPAEGVGFLVVETEASARRAGRPVLATIAGMGLAAEPHPFVSDQPCQAQGLTEACVSALGDAGVAGQEIGAVLCDLDGEFHRSKEWALTEIRCFGTASERTLLHPADCYGTVGASSAAVLLTIGAAGLSGGWLKRPTLVFCSDDTGECGAVVLTPPSA